MIDEQSIYCPYCGEKQTVCVDASAGDSDYIEDCQICCRPIEFRLTVQFDGAFELVVSHENESGY